jgi:hypothetical protein
MAYRPMIPGECGSCYLEDAARFAAMPKALKPKVLAELRAKNAKTAANINAYEKMIVAEEAARLQKLEAKEAARQKEIVNLKAREETMRAPSRAVPPNYLNVPFASQNLTNALKDLSRRNRRSARKAKKNTRRR